MSDTSSTFFLETAETKPEKLYRKFILSGKDISKDLVRWPIISNDSSKIRPGGISISVGNSSPSSNYTSFLADKTSMVASCRVVLGVLGEGAEYKHTYTVEPESKGSFQYYGRMLSMTVSGDYAAVSNIASATVDIYKRNPGIDKLKDTWFRSQIINDPMAVFISTPTALFGNFHNFGGQDGDFLVIGDKYYSATASHQGQAYLYKRQPLKIHSNYVFGNGKLDDVTTLSSDFGYKFTGSASIESGSVKLGLWPGVSQLQVGYLGVGSGYEHSSGHTYALEFEWWSDTTSKITVTTPDDVFATGLQGKVRTNYYNNTGPLSGSPLKITIAANVTVYVDNFKIYDVDSVDHSHPNIFLNGDFTDPHSNYWDVSCSFDPSIISYMANSLCVYFPGSDGSANNYLEQGPVDVVSGSWYEFDWRYLGAAEGGVRLSTSRQGFDVFDTSALQASPTGGIGHKRTLVKAKGSTMWVSFYSYSSSFFVYHANLNEAHERYVPVTSITHPDVTTKESYFGWACDVDNGGVSIAISAMNHMQSTALGSGNTGAVYVYGRNIYDDSLYLKSTLVGAGCDSGCRYGETLTFQKNQTLDVDEQYNLKDRLVVAAPFLSVGTPFDGAIFVCVRSVNHTYSEVASYHGDRKNAQLGQGNNQQCKTIAVNQTGTKIAVGAGVSPTLAGSQFAGQVHILTHSKNNFVGSFAVLESPNTYAVPHFFGYSVAFVANNQIPQSFVTSAQGEEVLAVGMPQQTLGYNDNSNTGAVAIYRYNTVATNGYKLVDYVYPTEVVSESYFGQHVVLNGDGRTLMASAPDHPSTNDAGAVFFMEYNPHADFNTEDILRTEEYNLFEGNLDNISYNQGVAILSFSDKFKTLGERTVGNYASPATYLTNSVFAGDVFWSICVSYGGLDSTSGSGNIDIDWESYWSWHASLVDENVVINGQLTGQKCLEALAKLARVTDTYFSVERGKIFTRRWSHSSSILQNFTDNEIYAATIDLNKGNLINQQSVACGYDTSSRTYTIDMVFRSDSSQSVYGVKEQFEKDPNLWLVSSATAKNFAERKVYFNNNPTEKYSFTTPIVGVTRHVGDQVTLTDSLTQVNSKVTRITNISVDLDSMRVKFKADPSIIMNGFFLDQSTLDNTTDFLT